jgi:tRNA A37 methylthiotransferase MiaB
MVDQIPGGVKESRSQELQRKSTVLRRHKMALLVGQTRRVLVETLDGGRTPTTRYYPVRFLGRSPWNTFTTVRLVEISDEAGEPVFEAEEVV